MFMNNNRTISRAVVVKGKSEESKLKSIKIIEEKNKDIPNIISSIRSRQLSLRKNQEYNNKFNRVESSLSSYTSSSSSSSVLSNYLNEETTLNLKNKSTQILTLNKNDRNRRSLRIIKFKNSEQDNTLIKKNRKKLSQNKEPNYTNNKNNSNLNKQKLKKPSIENNNNRVKTQKKTVKTNKTHCKNIDNFINNGANKHSLHNNNDDEKSIMTPSPSKVLSQSSVVASNSTAAATATTTIAEPEGSITLIESETENETEIISLPTIDLTSSSLNQISPEKDIEEIINKITTTTTTTTTTITGATTTAQPSEETINLSYNSDTLSCNGSPIIQTITSPLKKNNDNNQNNIINLPNSNSNNDNQDNIINLPNSNINNINNNSNNNNNSSNNHLNNNNGNTTTTNGSKQNYPHSSSTFSLNKNEEFHFIKPSECPVFSPTEEEFKNPLAYIGKIRSFAEKYGIAKILPPKSWTPPFTVDVDKLKFTPRVQRLNELEAKTRVKLNFLDQIAKFWELQGSSLKIPMVERKALDLYSLHRIVQEEGGIEQTTKERKWSRVATRMGYPSGKSIGAILKGHYERILNPFDIFTSGKTVDIKLETEIDDQDYKPHGIVSRQQITPPNETTARRSKRFANATQATCGLGLNSTNNHCPPISSINNSQLAGDNKLTNINNNTQNVCVNNNGNDNITSTPISPSKEEIKDEYNSIGYGEYKRMHSYGFGGKMAIGGCGRNRKSVHTTTLNASMKRKQKKNDPLSKYICHFCNRGDAEENMLLCDGCDDSYHTFCLMPPLSDIPKGDWRCPKCVVEEVSKPQEAFGFEQAQREYTLQQFGEMADQFKADYFNMAVHLVPTELVEREFWRIVSSIDEDVTVEYGADLHSMDHGSGFPTKSSLYLLPGDQEYAESSWNLNNLPILEESILGHINADISGMKVPWMYVGMCFATFCWHNEDHWSYSINYLHWGEPKTWYGVPGSKAEEFEETMKSAAPELFHSQPDLLHQLVTIMNPNILMKNDVPVYRTDQHAGEFVITFPRAYHAGFNQGYNFAEAVNFAPADWMKMGRECINHYSMLRRFCVFSHDELVCKMALNPDKLNLGIATACYLDMAEMVDTEKKLRKSLLEWGVTKAEREAFELIPDDERQCDSCKTTCFLSAVTCSCTKSIVCLRHYTELCNCPPEKHTLQYRYTLDELPLMLKKLKVKAETFENWLSKVRDVLYPNASTNITLEELQNLTQEAEEKKFPSSVILERLNSAVLEAEKCVTVIQQLDINKMRTRTRNSIESAKYKLTMDELDLFVQEIDNLCCVIQEGQSVRDLQLLGRDFIESSKHILSKKLNKVNETDLEQLIEEGSVLCIDLPEMERLKCRLGQLKWYKRIREYRDSNEKMSLNDIHNFLKEGLNILPDYFIEKELVHLQKIVLAIEYWEEVAKKCFESGTQHELPEIEVLLERAYDIEGELPSEPALRDAVRKAKEWLHNVGVLQSNENYPYFHTLENVVNRGKNIPFHLEELKRMEEHLDAARSWKDKTAKTFLKKQTQFHLMDVLSPRSEAVMIGSRFKKKSPEDQFTEDVTPQQMVNQFKLAEEKEMMDMRELRKLNMEKTPLEDKYCICKRKFNGNMFNCQLCKDWFHEQCVPPPKNTVRPRPQNSTTPPGGSNTPHIPHVNYREKDRELKYLCPSCMRSRRPRLETILQLLVSLQRLPIRLPEGEALQCLTERAMNWQDRARQAFASENVTTVLTKLSLLSQKFDENSKGTSNKNEENCGTKIQSGNKKKFDGKKYSNNNGNSLSNSNCNDVNRTKRRHQAKSPVTKNSITSEDDEVDESSSEEEFRQLKISESIISAIVSQSKCESPASPTNVNISSPITVVDNCGNTLAKTDMPLINLDKITREKLEDLMMEGDLLEVSLDETLHLWKILNAAKPSISDLAHINYKYNLTQISNNILVMNNASVSKKRRSADDSGNVPTKKNTNAKSNALLTTLQQTISQSELVTKLKRGRKFKKLPKIALPSDSADQISSGNNSPDIDSSALLSGSPGPNTNSNNNISAIVSLTLSTPELTTSTTSITSTTTTTNIAATTTTIVTQTTTLTPKTIQEKDTPVGIMNLSGKKRKRAYVGNVTSKKAAATAAAAAAQAQLDQIAAIATTAASTSDDDEECSAPNCARPSGREVDWVQCDGGCNKWFHMFCVGLDKNEIKPDDDYICKRCKKTTHKSSGSISTTPTNLITSSTTINILNAATTNETATTMDITGLTAMITTTTTSTARISETTTPVLDIVNNTDNNNEDNNNNNNNNSDNSNNNDISNNINNIDSNNSNSIDNNNDNSNNSSNNSNNSAIDNKKNGHDIDDVTRANNDNIDNYDDKNEKSIEIVSSRSNGGSIIQFVTESDSKNILQT